MTDDVLLELTRERYEQELERRSHLTNIAGIYLAGTTVIIFILWDLYNNFPLGSNVIHILFYTPSCILVILTMLIIANFFGFFLGKTYRYMPLPSEIRKYVQDLDTYFDKNYDEYYKKKGTKEELKKQKLHKNILDAYITCVEDNHNTNNLRNKKIHKIGMYLLLLIIVLIMSLIPYSILARSQKIQVGSQTLLIEGAKAMPENDECNDTSNDKTELETKEKKSDTLPTEPKFPDTKLFKEGKKEPEEEGDE